MTRVSVRPGLAIARLGLAQPLAIAHVSDFVSSHVLPFLSPFCLSSPRLLAPSPPPPFPLFPLAPSPPRPFPPLKALPFAPLQDPSLEEGPQRGAQVPPSKGRMHPLPTLNEVSHIDP